MCTVGDVGPNNKYNEVSASAAWDLGYPDASGRSGPEGDFTTILYPGTAIDWRKDNLQEQINEEGK